MLSGKGTLQIWDQKGTHYKWNYPAFTIHQEFDSKQKRYPIATTVTMQDPLQNTKARIHFAVTSPSTTAWDASECASFWQIEFCTQQSCQTEQGQGWSEFNGGIFLNDLIKQGTELK